MPTTITNTSTGHIHGRMLANSNHDHQAAVLDAWLTAVMGRGPITAAAELRRTGLALRRRILARPEAARTLSAALAVLSDVVANTAGDVDA